MASSGGGARAKKSTLIVSGQYALEDNELLGAIDFGALLTTIKGLRCELINLVFLSPPTKSYPPPAAQTLTQLKSLGFKIEEVAGNRKKTNCPHCEKPSALETLRELDVALATKIMEHAYDGVTERILVFAGDGDFIQAIKAVKETTNIQVVGIGSRDTVSFMFEGVCDVIVWLDAMNDLVRVDWENKGSKVVITPAANAQQRPAATGANSPAARSSALPGQMGNMDLGRGRGK